MGVKYDIEWGCPEPEARPFDDFMFALGSIVGAVAGVALVVAMIILISRLAR